MDGFAVAGRKCAGTVGRNNPCLLYTSIYSGNHRETIECNAHGRVRILQGMHPDFFQKSLDEGESFASPEAVFTFSLSLIHIWRSPPVICVRECAAEIFMRLQGNWDATKSRWDITMTM